MISINKLKKQYNGVIVVDIPGLEINKGETIGLVGNNGAGKTTLFRMILDLIRADAGEVTINDENVARGEQWKQVTASYLDEGFLIDYLTPEEYFYFIGSLHQLNKAQVDEKLAVFSEFFNGEILNKRKYIRDLSKGNQCKVGVIASLLQKPTLLMLDEPFANIDPSTQIRLKHLLKELNQVQAVTTIISSHDLSHVTEISSRIILMEKGKIIKDIQTGTNTLKELEDYFSVIQ